MKAWRGGVNVSPSGNSVLPQSTRDRRAVQPDLTFLPVPTTYAFLRRLANKS
jgi:hypothetical protein